VELGSYLQGAMIPVKFQLFDKTNSLISNAVTSATIDGHATTSTDGLGLHWDGTQYILKMSTTGLAVGDHILQVTLDDSSVHEVLIHLSATGANVENGTLFDSSSTIHGGGWITINGGGYAAGATVTVDLCNTFINTTTANSTGWITDKIQIPMTTADGTWIITATGLGADGSVRVDSAVITIPPP